MLTLDYHPTGRHFLQIPGPSPVPDRVLRAMSLPTIDHRGPEFGALGLKVLAEDALKSIVARGVVRQEFVKELLDQRLPQHPHYYGTMVWILIMLEHWFRRYAPDWTLAAQT